MTLTIGDLPYIDVYSNEFLEDPDTVVADARGQELGMARSDRGIEVLSYEAVAQFLCDARFGAATVARLNSCDISEGPAFDLLCSIIIGQTPGEAGRQMHRRQRRAVAPWFTTERADQFRSFARTWIDQVLDDHLEDEEFDFQQFLSRPLPTIMLCTMVGAPLSDAETIRQLARDIVQYTQGSRPDAKGVIEKAALDFERYVLDLIAQKRSQPGEDMISVLLAAEARNEITPREIVSLVFTVLLGGNDTTNGQICKNMVSLAGHPDQWHLLQSDPDLVPSAMDELIRFNDIVMTPAIKVSDSGEAIELRDVAVLPDMVVNGCVFSADKDPKIFTNPQDLDLKRIFRRVPLSFGQGIHSCVGRAFAMVMMEEVLASALAHWHEFEVDSNFVGSPNWLAPEYTRMRFTAKDRVTASTS